MQCAELEGDVAGQGARSRVAACRPDRDQDFVIYAGPGPPQPQPGGQHDEGEDGGKQAGGQSDGSADGSGATQLGGGSADDRSVRRAPRFFRRSA